MKKSTLIPTVAIYVAVLILGAGAILYFVMNYSGLLKGKSGLLANLLHGNGKVYLDGKELGMAPIESSEISAGEHKVAIERDNRRYEVSYDFLSGTQVVVTRDLGSSDTFSGGQNFWIEDDSSGALLSVISNPANASVFIDNTEVGKTPYSSSDLSDGEYDLRVQSEGYESQNARINVQKGHKLNVAIDLFPMPVPPKVMEYEDSAGLYNVVLDNQVVTADVENWIAGIIYWNETRGINLEGLGLNKEKVFDYFLDYRGNLYDGSGTLINPEDYGTLGEAEYGAYLGRSGDGTGLTVEATEAYEALTGAAPLGGKTATILPTGVGWLRVRGGPGLENDEVGRVDVGDTFTVLEEAVGWVKIRISADTVGWVSADYVELSE